MYWETLQGDATTCFIDVEHAIVTLGGNIPLGTFHLRRKNMYMCKKSIEWLTFFKRVADGIWVSYVAVFGHNSKYFGSLQGCDTCWIIFFHSMEICRAEYQYGYRQIWPVLCTSL